MNKYKKIAAPGKIHGGKSNICDWIVEQFPPRCKNPNDPAPRDKGYVHYNEPCVGMGSVMLANDPEGISESINDLNGDLTNFWRVLQCIEGYNQLKRLLGMIPFSQNEYDNATVNSALLASGYGETVHRAATFFIRCRQSLAGRQDSFNPLSRNRTRRGMNEQVSAWISGIDGLDLVHPRIRRVAITNLPAIKSIRQQDGKRTLHYIDPPYKHNTRTSPETYGEFEMSDADHEELLETLDGIEGRFVLSGYRSKMYDSFAKKRKWRSIELPVANSAAGGKTKRVMVEVLYFNY